MVYGIILLKAGILMFYTILSSNSERIEFRNHVRLIANNRLSFSEGLVLWQAAQLNMEN